MSYLRVSMRSKLVRAAFLASARYVRGHTRDERFARLNERVGALAQAALRTVETGRF
jgi:hypothetical protein